MLVEVEVGELESASVSASVTFRKLLPNLLKPLKFTFGILVRQFVCGLRQSRSFIHRKPLVSSISSNIFRFNWLLVYFVTIMHSWEKGLTFTFDFTFKWFSRTLLYWKIKFRVKRLKVYCHIITLTGCVIYVVPFQLWMKRHTQPTNQPTQHS